MGKKSSSGSNGLRFFHSNALFSADGITFLHIFYQSRCFKYFIMAQR